MESASLILDLESSRLEGTVSSNEKSRKVVERRGEDSRKCVNQEEEKELSEMSWGSLEEGVDYFKRLALEKGFFVRKEQVRENGLSLVCNRAGEKRRKLSEEGGKEKRIRKSIKCNCPFRVNIIIKKGEKNYKASKFFLGHNHPLDIAYTQMITKEKELFTENIISRVGEFFDHRAPPRTIRSFLTKMNISCSPKSICNLRAAWRRSSRQTEDHHSEDEDKNECVSTTIVAEGKTIKFMIALYKNYGFKNIYSFTGDARGRGARTRSGSRKVLRA